MLVLEQLSPDNCPHPDNGLQDNCPRTTALQTIVPQDNLSPGSCPPENRALVNYPRIIASQMISLETISAV